MKLLPSAPLPVELLATADHRRPPPRRRPGYVEAEQFDFDDLLEVAPYVDGHPAKRKGTETAHALTIRDSLERGSRCADILISLYSFAREVAPSGQITISRFVEMIRNESFEEHVYRVRHAPTEEAKGKAKRQLPAVQLSGRVTSGKRAQAIQ